MRSDGETSTHKQTKTIGGPKTQTQPFRRGLHKLRNLNPPAKKPRTRPTNSSMKPQLEIGARLSGGAEDGSHSSHHR
ncbi:hypothetical protein A2U01_0074779, partial [Trifolium medium]|nr:hypothetical protein [Trifolium medium]